MQEQRVSGPGTNEQSDVMLTATVVQRPHLCVGVGVVVGVGVAMAALKATCS